MDDKTYLEILETHLSEVVTHFMPDFMFYQSGVDVLATDKLGLLGLTQEGVRRRDALVLEYAAARNVPVVCSMGGGYSKQIRDIVNAHMHVFRLGQQLFAKN